MATSLINLEVAKNVAVYCVETCYRLTKSKLISQANILCSSKDELKLSHTLQIKTGPLKSLELFFGGFHESVSMVHILD